MNPYIMEILKKIFIGFVVLFGVAVCIWIAILLSLVP